MAIEEREGALVIDMKTGFSYEGTEADVSTGSWGRVTADAQSGGNDGRFAYYINASYFDDPETNAKIEAASRLTGEARRKAWADLDAYLMRDNPPVAPLYHSNTRAFVSKSFDCFFMHPFYGVDIAAACKK